MRLEFHAETKGGSARASRWVLERGRRMVGRSPECDWQLPENERSVSKVHCLIERKGDSFILEDRSSNGSVVDGVWLHDGAAATLRDQSIVALGNLSFRVSILGQQNSGQDDPDAKLSLSSETLTISSILSDIVPAGQMASGVLGPREIEDPFAFIQPPKATAPSSRNVDIGWSGPPEPAQQTMLLPENWWQETEGDTQFGHELEHVPATRVSVNVSRAAASGLVPERPAIAAPELDALPSADTSRAVHLEAVLRQLEQAMEQAFATLRLPMQPFEEAQALSEPTWDPLVARLHAVLAQQLQVNASLERMFIESGRLFDPRILEARADAAEKRGFGWLREAAYWRHYAKQFENGSGALSAAELLRKTYLTEEFVDRGGTTRASEEGKRPDEV